MDKVKYIPLLQPVGSNWVLCMVRPKDVDRLLLEGWKPEEKKDKKKPEAAEK